ncbi:thermonuclease family protein [Microvirga massiliensis]|uniref:thermonuclease family protein n=1 Tax=Microvirga massiliensis TaxID=1033741 RepID=UPI00062B66D0|nr:thermonuclease family protein [Microvirga massiliensis]
MTRTERRLLAAGLVMALVAGLVLLWPPESDVAPLPAPPRPAPEPARKAEALPLSDAPKYAGRADTSPPPTPLGQEFELEPPYRILDGLTLAAGPVTVTLDGLEGPEASAACRAPDRALWACGLQARAALNNATRQRRLTCRGSSISGDVVRGTCHAEGEDLASLLVREGWARPISASQGLQPELAEARENHRGLWNGDWAIAEVSPPGRAP